jgi:hypothetical protein
MRNAAAKREAFAAVLAGMIRTGSVDRGNR